MGKKIFLFKTILIVILTLKSIRFMSENLNSNNIAYDELNQNNEEIDYKDLITRLKEIKLTITLLEKTIFR